MTPQEKKAWRDFREWKSRHDYQKKLKKPPSVSGSRRVHDKETGEWTYAPRSGYAGNFLRLFSLFLMILVVWNVATGAGYSSYKTAVGALYTFTETVGSVVKFTADMLNPQSYAEGLDKIKDGEKDYVIDEGPLINIVIDKCGFKYSKTLKDGHEVSIIIGVSDGAKLTWSTFWSGESASKLYVISSTEPDFVIGDIVKANWFWGYYTLRNKSRDVSKIKYLEQTTVDDVSQYISGTFVIGD